MQLLAGWLWDTERGMVPEEWQHTALVLSYEGTPFDRERLSRILHPECLPIRDKVTPECGQPPDEINRGH
jgi:hypothetical protein